MRDLSKIKATIQSLLAKAKSTDSEAEAATFLAGAQRLLEKHQIEIGDLADADDPVVHSRGMASEGKWIPSWHRHLFRALGHLYGCESVRIVLGTQNWRQELVGRESAIVTTDLMFPYIKGEVMRLGKELAKRTGEETGRAQRSVANALEQRIWKLVRENKPQDKPKTDVAAKNALVTLDRVQQVLAQHYGKLHTGKGTKRTSSGGAREMAEGIGLHRQMGGAAPLALK